MKNTNVKNRRGYLMSEKKKILLIDDTETFLFMLTQILKDDYNLAIAKNGEDGLEIAKEQTPDLILLDIVMPGMSGYDVLKELKSDAKMKHIPVILITGNSPEDEGYSLGAAGYIKKPFVKSTVKERVAAQII